ncbi:hypothetical protein D6D01_01606 [Aureobasidium pullulans]|uniref:AA1-like domain-containing protein n=1 Tax=Aureobasidium pullulans TaxID=5580 RepID=A0A4S9LYH5_AURPU|nr:hypothetical protein D6D01_01606 [Aureobasidium pullulans]
MLIPVSFLLLLSVLSFTLASPAPTIVSSSGSATPALSKGPSRSISSKTSSISISPKAHSTFNSSKSSKPVSSKKLSTTVSSKRSLTTVSSRSSPAIVSSKKSQATVSSKQSSATVSPKTTSRSVSLKTSTSASSAKLSIPVPSGTTASTQAGPDVTSSSQTQAPFEVTYTGYHDPGQDHTLYPEYFFTTVSDPVTNTTTGCLFYRVYSHRVRYPSVWTYCEDPTFAIKMAYYSYNGPSWGLEFRHQYQEGGQKCDDKFSGDCTTVHAFVSVDSNTPGFTSNAGGFSETDYYKGPAYADM